MKEASIDDLLRDWRDKARWGPQEEKIKYLNKMNALTEDMLRLQQADTGLTIQAYQREDGSYFYSIKIPGAYGQQRLKEE